MRYAIFAAVLLTSCITPPTRQAADPAPVIAAERAFAADAAVRGWVAAFRQAAADDAITLSSGPVNAHENLARIEGDGSTGLDWRPAYAGIARSGEFGFTTGPFLVRGREGIAGHYFTVWRRQSDESWKWIFDAGTDVVDPGPAIAPDADVPTLPSAAGSAGSAEAAIAQVADIQLRHNSSGTLAPYLAADARVNRPGEASASGASARALFARPSALYQDSPQSVLEASASGDMVFTMGPAVWAGPEGAHHGYFARIWQWRREGWRIVFDELVPHRG